MDSYDLVIAGDFLEGKRSPHKVTTVGCRSCSFLWVETESGHDVAHTPYEVFEV